VREVLRRELPGYPEYCGRARFRLVPFLVVKPVRLVANLRRVDNPPGAGWGCPLGPALVWQVANLAANLAWAADNPPCERL